MSLVSTESNPGKDIIDAHIKRKVLERDLTTSRKGDLAIYQGKVSDALKGPHVPKNKEGFLLDTLKVVV